MREKTQANNPRIGSYKLVRQGHSFKDVWNDGYALEELNRKLEVPFCMSTRKVKSPFVAHIRNNAGY